MSYLYLILTILKAIESELIRINTCQQSAPVFSESMQILLEKAWIHASTKWQCNHIDIPVFFTTLINIRDSILFTMYLRHYVVMSMQQRRYLYLFPVKRTVLLLIVL